MAIRGWILRTSACAAALALVAPLCSEDAGDAPPRRVHESSDGLVEHVLGATRAFLNEDGGAVRDALDGAKRASPRLDRERDDAYGHEILSFDLAFHTTLDRAREYATAGDLDEAFNQFVWVQRACRTCHTMAREKGFLPAGKGP